MGSDITRKTFHRKKHYRKVRMQQGRVSIDADYNEQTDIDFHNETRSLEDLIGESGTPLDSGTGYSDGFKIVAGNPYGIKKGRYYVEGILVENEKDTTAEQQPDLPVGTPPESPSPSEPGMGIA